MLIFQKPTMQSIENDRDGSRLLLLTIVPMNCWGLDNPSFPFFPPFPPLLDTFSHFDTQTMAVDQNKEKTIR